MKEEELKNRFRTALGEPPASDLQSEFLERVSRQGTRRIQVPMGALAITVALLLVAAVVGWRLLALRQIAPAVIRPTPSATVHPFRSRVVDPMNCELPVVVERESGPPGRLTFEAGVVDTATGRYARDPNGSVAGLPGGGYEGSYGKPSMPSAPVFYSRAVGRWLPVRETQVAPDGRSYAWVELLPHGSNQSNFTRSALHVYDLTTGTDHVLWIYPGSIDISRWDDTGILADTVPPTGGVQLWWLIDPITGRAIQQPLGFNLGRPSLLPGDPMLHGGYQFGVFGQFQGRPLYRIGDRSPGSIEWIFYETSPGQRVYIYKGKQGDATGFDPFEGITDGNAIWFSDFETHGLWHWDMATGLRKINVNGLPAELPGPHSYVYVNPSGTCG